MRINNKHIIFYGEFKSCLDLHLLLSLDFLALHLLALFSFFFLVFCFLLIYGICCYGSNIPDICQIWDTTALFSPVKHTKNCLNLQQNSQKGQNRTTSRVLCAKKDTRLKKVHHHHCGGGNCEKYQLCLHTVFSTTQTFDHLVLVARPPRLTNFPSLVIMYFKLGNLTILGSLFFLVF